MLHHRKEAQWDSLWVGGYIATFNDDTLDIKSVKSAVAVKGGNIAWVGLEEEFDSSWEGLANKVHYLEGQWITPGFIDCHTHVVYGGNRADEFMLRLRGKQYEEIARTGGGIMATVDATRHCDEDALFLVSKKRLLSMLKQGVSVVEIKSGYGLDHDTELKMLRVARRLGEELPIDVCTTFLGAHTVPMSYENHADQYIDFLCSEVLPQAVEEDLVDAVDGFCENIAFTPAQIEKLFNRASSLGLPVKLHAEQLSQSGGTLLATKYKALSADHLEYVSEEAVEAMAQSNTVAVLLPGACYYLQSRRIPPVSLFRKYKVPMAIATDCNPGSSPVGSLLLMLNMACVLFGFTVEEALLGVTRHAAQALGIDSSHGTLTEGKAADFVVWDINNPVDLVYETGYNPCQQVIKRGEVVVDNR